MSLRLKLLKSSFVCGACTAGILFGAASGAGARQSTDAPDTQPPQGEDPAPFELDLEAILANDEPAQDEAPETAPLPTDAQNEALRERLNEFLTEGDPRAADGAAARPQAETVVLRALDKVTAQFTDLHVRIDEPTPFGALTLVARTCYKRPPEETPETTAFLQVYETGLSSEDDAGAAPPGDGDAQLRLDIMRDGATQADGADVAGMTGAADNPAAFADAAIDARPLAETSAAGETQPPSDPGLSDLIIAAPEPDPAPADAGPEPAQPSTPVQIHVDGRKIFSGWMFASSPALNPLEHPVYDVWVIDCIASAPVN